MEWTGHVDELLLDGEHERDRLELDAATVVVTNHRVLAFTPGRDGTDFEVVDRPNVRNVTIESDGNPRAAGWALVTAALGTALLLTVTAIDPDGVVEDVDPGGSGPATDAIDGALGAVATALTAFELALLLGALGLLALAGSYALRYGQSRSRRLVLRIAGDDDLDLPVTDADVEAGAVPALERAIGPGSDSRDGSTENEDADPARPDPTSDEIDRRR